MGGLTLRAKACGTLSFSLIDVNKRRVTSMDGVAKHRTERGSAGSTTTSTPENGVDPALPRSVLCLLTTVPTTKRRPNAGNSSHQKPLLLYSRATLQDALKTSVQQ